jgi:CheY-like chemotaxis protein
LTVFLAEDNDENLFIVQSNLKKIDKAATLIHAADGEEAIKQLNKSDITPDIFLIDISMPNKDGLELINWIKAESRLQNIPTVALTASVFAEMKESYLEHGFDHILEKPFTRRQLAELFEKVFA